MEKKILGNKVKMTLLKTQSPNELLTLKRNKNFCTNFFEKNKMATIVGEPANQDSSRELIYDYSAANRFDSEAFAKIIDLLTQLRAAGADQSIFVQNNTVLREQILNQLKNEILRVGHKLTGEQLKNLEVISSNTFDEKTLADMLKSLLSGSKKKLANKEHNIFDFNVVKKSRYVTLQKSVRDYLTVLNKTRHYENVVDKVLKNIYRTSDLYFRNPEKIGTSAEQDSLENEKIAARRLKKENIRKKTNLSDIEILEEATKYYEENVINKGILPKIVKIQSKISEFNILTKIGSFVENIIKESVPKILTSETALINKLVDKSEIQELRQNITRQRQQYVSDKTYYDRNISKMYSEVRKFYNTKNISKNIVDVLKTTKIKSLNFEENIRKNVIKLASRKDILNRFKNVYDNSVQKIISKRTVNQRQFINRYNHRELNFEETETIKNITDLRREGISIDKNFVENVRQNNVFIKTFNVRKNKSKQIHKSFDVIEINDIANKKINKPVILTTNVITAPSEILNGRDIYNIHPIYRHEKIFEENQENNVFFKRIHNVLSPRVFRNREFKLNAVNVYKEYKKRFVDRYIENFSQESREHLITSNFGEDKKSYYNHFENDYMVYKEKEKISLPESEQGKTKSKDNVVYKNQSTKKISSQREEPIKIDTQAIEKNIMSKTLSKEDIVGLIQSYVKDINVESISNKVIGKIERRAVLNRHRQGVF